MPVAKSFKAKTSIFGALSLDNPMQAAARIIENNKEQIIDDWVKAVRAELITTRETPELVLRDHVPLFLEDIITIMKSHETFDITEEKSNFKGMLDRSIGHGRHRSTSSGYDVEQVLREYIILHRILTKLLRDGKVYSTEIADLIKYIIESSMLHGVGAFTQSLDEIRQKLLGVLVHDLRNPISAAFLAIGALRQEDEPGRFNKVKEMTKNSISRSLELMENLLESVTVGPGEGLTMEFSQKDLLEYIESVYHEASEIYSNEIVLICDKDEIVGVFDCAMIQRVLENIVNNAVKYGSRKTKITMTVEDSSEFVTIDVHNSGNPIPEQQQKEIFKFLSTTNGEAPGKLKSWGMGLTIVKTVAREHGGTLKLVSNEEHGTTFSLMLGKYKNQPGKVKTALLLNSP